MPQVITFWGSMLLLCAVFVLKRNSIDNPEEKADTLSTKWTSTVFLDECWEHPFPQNMHLAKKKKKGGEGRWMYCEVSAQGGTWGGQEVPPPWGCLIDASSLPPCLRHAPKSWFLTSLAAHHLPPTSLWQRWDVALISHLVIAFRWFSGSFTYICIYIWAWYLQYQGNFKELGMLLWVNSGTATLPRAYPDPFLWGFEVRFKLVAYDFGVVWVSVHLILQNSMRAAHPRRNPNCLCKSELARGTFWQFRPITTFTPSVCFLALAFSGIYCSLKSKHQTLQPNTNTKASTEDIRISWGEI